MPEIDRQGGLAFYMYFFDTGKHHVPHVHVKFGEYELVLSIADAQELAGYLPDKWRNKARKHVLTNKQKLKKMWVLAVNGKQPGTI
ncbi:TPA: type II toxin-antitoxin system toxin DhiT [Klebsiella variicola subsp. variicola]|jgi:hypothetical protein|uniref:type II toxin-antitoxin system toxin DhiT n=1 Tax=Enterobacteriaceae TaxID=543 RepID=UPI0003EDCEE2|nr:MULTISPECIES: DUF4160 domain-containing protein [Enterobacteriaceae]EAQ9141220.1 DUF4160 domain-containing protein [Salmonella enterica]EAW1228747.1 DUF4160 domain-containing protein [Salmonella enterica subsp. enterica]EDW0627463.1 DUF4160 domain-containing protein [Salmonella enterica subsp. enterica serovar Anatum]EGT4286281.1 DUF4160 domain-containing protein [Cronobacter sakazakii]EAT8688907.1 DUF4160 domain-containing protein [Salmonella enterica]